MGFANLLLLKVSVSVIGQEKVISCHESQRDTVH